ncbi:hypothetical protein AgCh_018426 [Apium graveolens]
MSKSHLPPVSPDVILPAANSDDHVRPSSHVLPPSFTNLVVGSPSASAPADPPDRAADYAVNLSVGPASASAPNSNADSAEPPARGVPISNGTALYRDCYAEHESVAFNNNSLKSSFEKVILYHVYQTKEVARYVFLYVLAKSSVVALNTMEMKWARSYL